MASVMRVRPLSASRLLTTLVFVVEVMAIYAAVNKVIHRAPHIVYQFETSEHAYKDGEEVEMKCMANAEAEATYFWKMNGEVLDLSNSNIVRLPDRGGSFLIKNPNQTNEGSYQCFASNSYGTAVTMRTQLKRAVLDPFPTVTDTTVHRPVVGQSLGLQCRPPRSYPTGNIYWGISKAGSNQLKAIDNNARVMLSYDGHLFFANVLLTDSRDDHKYVCIANNPTLGAHVQGQDQRVEPVESSGSPSYIAPRLLWSSPTRDIAIQGHTKKIKCIFGGLPTPTVTWERIGGTRSDRVRETIEGYGTEIQITNVEFEDGGTYRCTARNGGTGESASQDIDVVVEAAPYWRSNRPPGDIEADEEDDVELDCQADGRPRPTVTWSINGTDPRVSSRRTVIGNKIVIHNVTQKDRGIFQCEAENKYGTILANAVLSVEASRPSFTATPTDAKIVEGQNAVFTCNVYGAPRPKVTWLRGSPPTPVAGDRFIFHSNGNLEVKSAALDDQDSYHCEAKNKFGTESASCNFIVRRPTVISRSPVGDITVNATDDVVIPCSVTTDPNELANLVVEWRKDGKPIRPDGVTVIVDPVTHALTIKSCKVADTAGYTLHASNGLDSATSDTTRLVVQDRPGPPRDVRITSCNTDLVTLAWSPGPDSNSPIIEYIVYHTDSTADDPTQLIESARVSAPSGAGRPASSQTPSAVVPARPWTSYAFHVVARNALGTSERASQSASNSPAVCDTPQSAPRRNPRGVCSRLDRPTQLVIVWEPMPRQEHNGEGFKYVVGYRLLTVETMSFAEITNPATSELVIYDQQENQEYEIYVQAVNNRGSAPVMQIERRKGFSGEGKPTVIPQNLLLRESTLNSTYAEFNWDPVDTRFEMIKGFFKGYQIQYWREVDQPRVVRTTDIIIGPPIDLCPPMPWSPSRRRRSAGRSGPVLGAVADLWPFSTITAGVLVQNHGNNGTLSETISFTTPEGVPAAVGTLSVIEKGSSHLTIQWSAPVFANGILLSYVIEYKVGPPNVGAIKPAIILDPSTTTQRLTDLEPNTEYVISVSATTRVGLGVTSATKGKTLPTSAPDVPAIGGIQVGEDSANVSWSPSTKEPASNPGAKFYVEYIKASDADAGLPWNRSDPDPAVAGAGGNWAHVGNLTNGEKYYFRVVAVNGAKPYEKETRSNPPWVEIIGFSATESSQAIIADPGESRASADWFIILMCIIAFLLLILLIVCIIQRTRGQIYPVYEKERIWGHDPNAPEDAPFGEYTRNNEPSDVGRSQGSLDSDDKPIESETDSLGEYEDQDPSKFNEDGSFIGQYTRRNQPTGGRPGSTPSRHQPPAPAGGSYNTFV